jgi:ATP-dependent helicase/nuclease subunit A
VLSLAAAPDPMAPGPVVWMRSIKAMPAAVRARVDEERERDREEYRRLLYVGMTRAKDRLYVAGIVKQKLNDDTRWHPLVVEALEGELVDAVSPEGEPERVWRPDALSSPLSSVTPIGVPAVAATLPHWVTARLPPAESPARRLTPSSVGLDDSPPPAANPAREKAIRAALHRGRIVHRLLESLPVFPAENRHSAASDYLAAFAGDDLSAADRAALLDRVLTVMEHPDFAPVFAPGSRAEVEIAGRINGLPVAGRIDRLAVSADRVLIVDYKTNRPAPENLADVPEGYITQLALYRLVLSRLYPGRRIAAALLWTEIPRLMEIPEAMLLAAESALPRA